MTRIAVIGAGAWGTAIADLLTRGGHAVHLWAYEAEVAQGINSVHTNTRFLSGFQLDPGLRASTVLADVLAGADLVFYAAPSHALRAVAKASAVYTHSNATLVVATKGIERDSLALMTDVVTDELPGRAVVALSGPSFAAEVIQRQPTAIVAASTDAAQAARIQDACSSPEFRVYTHDDVTGVELGGALKNVMAIAVGIADGVGLGYNSRAAIITRGLAEMARLGVALGASPSTFAGLAGVGDLVLTCTGPLSRNRAVGVEIGKGRALADVLAERDTVAEGVQTAASARALAQTKGITMPIVESVHGILFDGVAAHDAIRTLMTRELKGEPG